MRERVKCSFCKSTVAHPDEGIDRGWYPCFHARSGPDGSFEEYLSPVCRTCLEDHFSWDGPDGEPNLKSGHEHIIFNGNSK